MPPTTKNEIAEALAAIHSLEHTIKGGGGFVGAVDKGAKYIAWLWAYSAALAGGMFYVWSLRADVDGCKRIIDGNSGRVMQLESAARDNEREIIRINNIITANRTERQSLLAALESRIIPLEKDSEKTGIMWGMKENGVSNKEMFLFKNHYPAPDKPEK